MGAKIVLSRLNYSTLCSKRVESLPSKFNGNVLYELPSSYVTIKLTMVKLMVEMDKRFDCHPRYKTMTTDICNNMNLTSHYSNCASHL